MREKLSARILLVLVVALCGNCISAYADHENGNPSSANAPGTPGHHSATPKTSAQRCEEIKQRYFTIPQPQLADSSSNHESQSFGAGPPQSRGIIPGTGQVNFPVTTKSQVAQSLFEQGVAQMHGFLWYEAKRSFHEALKADPNLVMAYWGLAMANQEGGIFDRTFSDKAQEYISKNYIDKAFKEMEVLEAKGQSLTVREKLWIKSLRNLLSKKGRKEYTKSLRLIVRENPDDLEAKAFLALALWQDQVYFNRKKSLKLDEVRGIIARLNQNCVTSKSEFEQIPNILTWLSIYQAYQMEIKATNDQLTTEINALLDEILAKNPNHPGAHHYRIHANDSPETAEKALESALRSGASSPGIAHMWHMPAHIYVDLRQYAKAAWQQEASARVDHAYMQTEHVMPYEIGNYSHNNDWLVENLEYSGAANKAIAIAKNLMELPQSPEFDPISKGMGQRRLIETLTKYEMWPEVIALENTEYLSLSDDINLEQQRLSLIAIAHLYVQPKEAASVSRGEEAIEDLKCITELKKTVWKDASPNEPYMVTIEIHRAIKLRDKAMVLEKLQKFEQMMAGEYWADLWINSLRRQVYSEFGMLDKAEEVARADVDGKFRRGRFQSPDQKPAKATQETEEVQPLASLIEILYRNGKIDEARLRYQHLLTLVSPLDVKDLELPVFKRLRAIDEFKDFGLKPAAATLWSEDERHPKLETLGSLMWKPEHISTELLNVKDLSNNAVSLKDYAGKNVLVILNFGAGCEVCRKQMDAIIQNQKEFKEASVELLVITNESREELIRSAKSLGGGHLPFRLASNSDDPTGPFKALRAYDDFRNGPMHGLFFIDAQGNLRWQDIGEHAFIDFKFLIPEMQRLLRITPAKKFF